MLQNLPYSAILTLSPLGVHNVHVVHMLHHHASPRTLLRVHCHSHDFHPPSPLSSSNPNGSPSCLCSLKWTHVNPRGLGAHLRSAVLEQTLSCLRHRASHCAQDDHDMGAKRNKAQHGVPLCVSRFLGEKGLKILPGYRDLVKQGGADYKAFAVSTSVMHWRKASLHAKASAEEKNRNAVPVADGDAMELVVGRRSEKRLDLEFI